MYIDESTLEYGHNACPNCQSQGRDSSGDNLYYYGEGQGYFCFGGCGLVKLSDEYLDENSVNKVITRGEKVLITQKDKDALINKALTPEQVKEIEAKTSPTINVKYRGIPSSIYESLGVRWEGGGDTGQPISMYYPITVTEDGKPRVVGYKVRRHPKDFYSIGYVGKLGGFLNQSNAVADTLIITAGECFTEDTEVMTDRGFVKFPDLLESDLILQVDEDLRGTFVKPLARVKKKYEGDLVYQKTSTTNSLTTPNHNLVFKDRFGEIFKQKAQEHVNTNWSIPKNVVVNGKGTGLSKDEIKLVIAICADGSLRNRVEGNNVVHFGFMKKRKIERLQGILNRLGISYSSYTNTYQSGKTYTTFNFRMPDYLKTKELPREWIVDASLDERLFILEEIRYWDGYYNEERKSTEFTSKHYSEVSYIQELAHTSGKYASVAHRRNKFGEWYRCMISENNFNTSTQKLTSEVVSHKGYVYCVTVPTGMILTRHEGRIMVNGNCDLASAIHGLEMDKYRKSYNVVSSPLGEDSTAMMIKLNYDWVNAHKKIVVCMDNDLAGEKAFEKIKEVIDAEKLFKANIALNDLNDYLKEGRGAEIANCIYWSPLPTIDFGISGSGTIYDSMVELAKKEKVKLPPFLDDLNNMLAGGVGVAELVLLVAPPSVGKSSIVNQWILDWLMNSPYKLFVVSIEDSKASFGLKIASKISNINIMGLEEPEEKLKVLDENKEAIDKYLYNEDGSDRFNILEKIPNDIEDLKKAILQAVVVHGCKVVVVDPLSALLASMSNEQQVDLMAFFEGLKRDHEIIAILCLHTRKSGSGQKDISEGADYGESDIRGSSSIAGTGTITIMLSRDKYAEDEIERNTTNISLPKNRSASKTGRNVAKVYYSPEHSTLFSYEYAMANNFFKDVTPDELRGIMDDTKATVVIGEDEVEDVEVYNEF